MFLILIFTVINQVHKFGGHLPQSLLRLLISDQVFKIGSSIKADFTRLKKQFPQLEKQRSFNVIDLKEYCTQRGIIPRKGSGALDILLEKTSGMYLSKDENLRRSEDWETREIRTDLLQYAALDVYASRIVFEKATEIAPPASVDADTAPGTRIVLLVQDGGAPVAYGKVAATQPMSLGHVRVKVPTKSRLVVEIDNLVLPSASATLHLLPGGRHGKAKAGTYTLGQLRDMSGSDVFQVVASLMHLRLDMESHSHIPVRILTLNIASDANYLVSSQICWKFQDLLLQNYHAPFRQDLQKFLWILFKITQIFQNPIMAPTFYLIQKMIQICCTCLRRIQLQIPYRKANHI